jgi:hypothetical protein
MEHGRECAAIHTLADLKVTEAQIKRLKLELLQQKQQQQPSPPVPAKE